LVLVCVYDDVMKKRCIIYLVLKKKKYSVDFIYTFRFL